MLVQATSQDKLDTHNRQPDCINNHLNYTVEGFNELKARLDVHEAELKKSHNAWHRIQAVAPALERLARSELLRQQQQQKTMETVTEAAVATVAANKENIAWTLPPELEKYIQKTPLMSYKNLYFTFQTQSTLSEMKVELETERKNNQDMRKELLKMSEEIRKLKDEQNHLGKDMALSKYFGSSSHSLGVSDAGFGSDDSVKNDSTSMEFADHGQLTQLMTRVELLEKTCEELKNDRERCKQLERFVMHLHERIKSLDCGRTGVFIWKITGFDAIFQNAKRQHDLKVKGMQISDNNSACDFCSPLFYTAPNGYLMYMRLYPFGCDSAAGNFVSLFVALSPGEYDGVLKWPFLNSIEISLLSQDDPADKWTQVITPGGNNMTCFQRPSSKSGNMSVGILHFIIHKLVVTIVPIKSEICFFSESEEFLRMLILSFFETKLFSLKRLTFLRKVNTVVLICGLLVGVVHLFGCGMTVRFNDTIQLAKNFCLVKCMEKTRPT